MRSAGGVFNLSTGDGAMVGLVAGCSTSAKVGATAGGLVRCINAGRGHLNTLRENARQCVLRLWVVTRRANPSRCTLPITALRVTPPNSPAISLALCPSPQRFLRNSTRSLVHITINPT
jgi:hypothetical protein